MNKRQKKKLQKEENSKRQKELYDKIYHIVDYVESRRGQKIHWATIFNLLRGDEDLGFRIMQALTDLGYILPHPVEHCRCGMDVLVDWYEIICPNCLTRIQSEQDWDQIVIL